MTNLNEKQLITEIVGLARSQGLTVHSENAQLNETGMDFQVVFAKDDTGMPWVLRKPRRSDVVERASAEGITLAFLRANLTADVPDWRIHTPELIAYPMLKGTPAAGIDLEQKQYVWNMDHQPPSDDFVRTLADILAELHGTDQISAGQSGIEVIRPEDFRQMTADSMVDVKNKLGVSTTLWERWQKWVDDDAYWPGFSSLIHGDLHRRISLSIKMDVSQDFWIGQKRRLLTQPRILFFIKPFSEKKKLPVCLNTMIKQAAEYGQKCRNTSQRCRRRIRWKSPS